jgi:hypothetical protein
MSFAGDVVATEPTPRAPIMAATIAIFLVELLL